MPARGPDAGILGPREGWSPPASPPESPCTQATQEVAWTRPEGSQAVGERHLGAWLRGTSAVWNVSQALATASLSSKGLNFQP